jgi:hypothetical protein
MSDESCWESNGSYESPNGVFLIDPLKHQSLFELWNKHGPALREATSSLGKKFCTCLLVVDSKFNYEILFEDVDPERWIITKINGANGIPLGLDT